MKDLKYYQKIIQDKRKQSSFRDFLVEIGSWYPGALYNNNGLISKFPDTPRVGTIIPKDKFEAERDELSKHGRDYDFSKNLFENFSALFLDTGMCNVSHYGSNSNCNFSESVLNGKNVYLTFASINDCENIGYCISIKDASSNIFNAIMVQQNSGEIYFASAISQSYKVFYSRYISNSDNIWFSTNLIGCSECIECDNLENMSYCIENIQYSQQEYNKMKKEILEEKDTFLEKYKALKLGGNNIGCENSSGDALFNCFDVVDGHHSFNVKGGKNLFFCGGAFGVEEAYDVFGGGSPTAEHLYGIAGANGDNVYCCCHVLGSHIFYSYYLENCSHCIGCVGLKNKQYCILNKQYPKKEWEALADKIFSQMEQDGLLGKFFPGYINPYYINDTMAGIVGDLTKEEMTKDGYMWRDNEIKTDIPEGSDVVKNSELNNFQGYDENGNWKINPDILNKVIVDEKGDYYRIVRMEYDFLIKHSLPLPEIHWMDRMKLNFGA